MSYVLDVMTQFNSGQNEVSIKARGKAISRAVDVSEIVSRKFASDVKVKSIEAVNEEREFSDKGKIAVSTVSITLAKKPAVIFRG